METLELQELIDQMPLEDDIYLVAELYKNFGDFTRVKILYALTVQEMCVNDLATMLNMSQSSISHQLRVLKQARLIKYVKKGKNVIYSLADSHVKTLLDQAYEHIKE
ncbi:MAG: helix-turn-helix transcriptional regulator [Erysipelotrichaceae bacterium]|nr:helix-turn-helix transcriptional regulator [Erysipelotrichaceae bacterium]MBR3693745.1 helix-turn-helix transcriptional regulator [Erysipelotrichales bacterium]